MIHIFDVDYTVIKKPSAWYFLREAMHGGVIKFSQVHRLPFEFIKYKLGRPNMDFIDDAVRHIAGTPRHALEQIAQTCFEKRMKGGIYSDAARLIRGALGRGERVIFATSSLHIMVRPLEAFFGIECSIAGELEFINGDASGKIAGGSFFGPKKKAAALAWLGENGLGPESACFYSDSYTDLPLMECCGKAVAVNPDRVLAKEAKKRGWEILRFKETLAKLQDSPVS